MNEKKKRRYSWCASCIYLFLYAHTKYLGAQTVFPEEDGKKRISISHLLEGN